MVIIQILCCDHCGLQLGENYVVDIKTEAVIYFFCSENCCELFNISLKEDQVAQDQVIKFLKNTR
ncbi:hypothetical protein DRJ17_01330 [Candidatus Woesearchaeota archaeon]|nr:MAG: hypothetical protein DRJ17_01330 [Candidatus Woesearchaeota archaeon]